MVIANLIFVFKIYVIDCVELNYFIHYYRSQSKVSLTPENETSQKISEEMSRLIILANTVLGTKLPDLLSTYSDNPTKVNDISLNDIKKLNDPVVTLTLIEEDIKSTNEINTTNMEESQKPFFDDFSRTPPKFDVPDEETANIKQDEIDISATKAESERIAIRKISIDRKNEFNCSHFLEDESGFSSMSSFQDIGIPIISIIPPSPCKELGYMVDMPDIIEDSEKWKTDTIDLGKQTMKVFWV